MRPAIFIIAILSIMSSMGCGTDYKAVGDEDVETRLLKSLDKKEAIPFFEQKGYYFDFDPEAKTKVDHEIVLPLLKRLQEIAATDQWAMLRDDNKNWALALIIKLPSDRKKVDLMVAAVQEADDRFPGYILRQWGHHWLSIDLIDNETYEYFKKSDPDFDKQP